MIPSRVSALFLSCLTLPLFAFARTGDSLVVSSGLRDSISEMDEVAVYAQRRDEIVPSQRLSGKRLQSLSAFSVADAMRYFSGVQLKDYGGVGGLKTIDIRSMGTNHMGVFYDGIQLGNAQNGLVDLGRFSLDNVEEIALYNGQKAQIFQPARDYGTSGSVYIRTRRPVFEEGKTYNLRTSLKGGSFDLINPSIVWEQKWSRRVSSSVSADYTGASGKYKFRYRRVLPSGEVAWDTTAVRDNGDIRSYRVEASVFGNTNDGTWNAKAYFYDSARGIPGAIVSNVWKHAQRQWDRNFFAQGQWTKHVSDRYKFQVNGKYANDWMRYLNPDTTLMYQDNRFRQHELYLSTAHHVELLPGWQINVAADYQYNTLDASLTHFVYPRRHALLAALASQYEYKRFRVMASLLGTYVWDKTTKGITSDHVHKLTGRWTPAVYLSCQPLADCPDFSLRAFYKGIFRLPTFNDLYYTEVGNVRLEPETTRQWNLGFIHAFDCYRGLLRHIEVKADGYFNIVDNKIVAIPKGSGQYRWMMMNVGKVHIAGVEATVESVLRWHRDWSLVLCLNYTYQSATDRSDPLDNDPYYGTYGGQIAYVPHHSGSVTGNLVWRNAGLNYSFIYVGERYHASANIRENYEQPWYTHDLSATYRMPLRHCAVTFAVECNNVFDQQYDVVLNYPMPGRNWKGVMKVEF
ncbi:MAG: TonB-dependent receptor [Paraprevotella sp.]|nr:TonB-dependent receptor [Paraprevotella sp.]